MTDGVRGRPRAEEPQMGCAAMARPAPKLLFYERGSCRGAGIQEIVRRMRCAGGPRAEKPLMGCAARARPARIFLNYCRPRGSDGAARRS